MTPDLEHDSAPLGTKVKANLIAAKVVYESNAPRWSFHQAVDYSAGDETDDDYRAMMDALKAAVPDVPPPRTDIVRWSKSATHQEILALFDRAIAKAEGGAA